MSFTAVRGAGLGPVDVNEFESPEQRYRIRGEQDFVPIPHAQGPHVVLGLRPLRLIPTVAVTPSDVAGGPKPPVRLCVGCSKNASENITVLS